MSTLSSETDTLTSAGPISSFSYKDMGTTGPRPAKEAARPRPEQEGAPPPPPGIPLPEVEKRVRAARADAVAETEAALSAQYDDKANTERAKIAHTLELFRSERRDYFSRVETEVVQLSLAIAAKILHREAQVDPMLLTALVRVAIEKLHDGSNVSVRVAPDDAAKWRTTFATRLNGTTVEVTADAQLNPGDCILTTELGSTNFGIDAQLKEVEKGFFDLLVQRPQLK
jgi:flagellar assembly protein FliH